jgi:hypothetical protein
MVEEAIQRRFELGQRTLSSMSSESFMPRSNRGTTVDENGRRRVMPSPSREGLGMTFSYQV